MHTSYSYPALSVHGRRVSRISSDPRTPLPFPASIRSRPCWSKGYHSGLLSGLFVKCEKDPRLSNLIRSRCCSTRCPASSAPTTAARATTQPRVTRTVLPRTFPAPLPGSHVSDLISTTGTGLSGEMRPQLPQMYRSSMKSPTTIVRTDSNASTALRLPALNFSVMSSGIVLHDYPPSRR